ncbi:MAG TPA: hypothetical protein VN081_02055 [Dongiaceae bacterium]|nr:hypothetical protein [Dongiaceae bacterium]
MLLIEQVDGIKYGVMDGVVVPSGERFTLTVKDLSDGSIHRFPTPTNFDWYQTKYFIDSTWWRRHKFMTRAALELRNHTYQLFDAALAKGVYTPEEADEHRDSSDWSLRWNLSARLGMSISASWEELMTRIQGM